MKRLVLLLVIAAGLYAGRAKLVDLLTTTTGTWVGSPTNRSSRP